MNQKTSGIIEVKDMKYSETLCPISVGSLIDRFSIFIYLLHFSDTK